MLQKLNGHSRKLFSFIIMRARGLPANWVVLLSIVVIALLALLSWAAYLRWGLGQGWADWTGFANYTGPLTKDQRGKTLWDWFELLIIPMVLALGAFFLQRSERDSDRKIAQDRFEREQKLTDQRIANEQALAAQRRQDDQMRAKDQQEEMTLQAYFDRMTQLLLDEKHPLRRSERDDEVRVVARTLTVTTLRNLEDPRRARILLDFLYDAFLITRVVPTNGMDWAASTIKLDEPIINLRGVNMHEVESWAESRDLDPFDF